MQIGDAQRRVQAIATVHQQLHLAGSLEFIEIKDFLASLCDSLKQTAPACITSIDTHLDHASIRSDQASTMGLIVAELLANSFKYAYTGEARGPVSVGFFGDQQHWRLTVSDHGVGLPDGFDPNLGQSVGMRVITALVRRLNAKLTYTSSVGGTVFEVAR